MNKIFKLSTAEICCTSISHWKWKLLLQQTGRRYIVPLCCRYIHKECDRKNFFITTPIFYVNSSPHLGHLYTAVMADAAQRFQKLLGIEETIFSTGTDEHGLKIQQAAAKAGLEPSKFCEEVSGKYKNLFDQFSIQYTDYIRTTEHRHRNAVTNFFNVINDKGYIYKDNYAGWYCVSDETFLTEKQVKKELGPNGNTKVFSEESGHPVEWSSETNYIFKLSHFQNDLLYWLKHENRIVPSRFQNELILWITNGLTDLSISRPSTRVPWGIPLPCDSNHTIYVWLDALVNYLTVAGYPEATTWPPNLQVIGKDILRFHGIYWPALLIAAGLDPPHKILVHSHWQVDGVKMSKSKGNVLCPFGLYDKFTGDGVRYVLLRKGTLHSDNSWSNTQAARCLNAELANTLGNLLNRCVAPTLNPEQTMPSLCENFLSTASYTCKSLLDKIEQLPDEVEKNYLNHNYYMGIDVIMSMLRLANLFIEEERPWELRNSLDRSKLDSVLYVGLLSLKAAALSLQPIVPNLANNLLNALQIPSQERLWSHLRDSSSLSPSSKLGSRKILFKKIIEE